MMILISNLPRNHTHTHTVEAVTEMLLPT